MLQPRENSIASEKLFWEGTGINEVGRDENGKIIIKVSPEYFRPTEVESLLGDATKAKTILKWKPKITFEQLVSDMVNSDLERFKK